MFPNLLYLYTLRMWPHHPLTVLLYLYMRACSVKYSLMKAGCQNIWLASATNPSIWVCLAAQIYILWPDIRDIVENYTTMEYRWGRGWACWCGRWDNCHHISYASLFDLGASPLILPNQKHVLNTRIITGEDCVILQATIGCCIPLLMVSKMVWTLCNLCWW